MLGGVGWAEVTYHAAGNVQKSDQRVHEQAYLALQYRDPFGSEPDEASQEGGTSNKRGVPEGDGRVERRSLALDHANRQSKDDGREDDLEPAGHKVEKW